MTIRKLLQNMEISRYRLSKTSGILWATLSDIYSGKTKLNRCDARTLTKLSKALGRSIEKLLELESVQEQGITNGIANSRTYLETGLPEIVQKALMEYSQGEKEPREFLAIAFEIAKSLENLR